MTGTCGKEDQSHKPYDSETDFCLIPLDPKYLPISHNLPDASMRAELRDLVR